VTLRDARSELEASFVPGAGMLCSSLRHRGEELLAQNAGVAVYARDGATMGVPLLYPWANRLAEFDYPVAGKTVALPRDRARVALDDNGLPIHGVIGGRMAWETSSPTGAGDCELTARMTWSESQRELFELFPFRHELTYTARLRAEQLEISVAVRATGSDAVPLAFGFHPYLTLPGVARELWTVELPPMRRLVLDAQQIPLEPGEPLSDRRFTLGTQTFDDGFDHVAANARFGADAGRRLELLFLEGYTCAQVFAPAGAQYICFEPMTAPTNALRSGRGLQLLAPDHDFVARFAICVSGAS
jgi:galactose mutarotase-like enzyme